jgi:outer membrane lipoprotein-sorting protein
MTATGRAQEQPDPETWFQDAEAAYANVTNYTAIFHKQQLVDGKLHDEDSIFIKFRKPFSLYMRWISAPDKGCELLFVEGWNENRARVHKGGFFRFITRNLEPKSPRLMVGNLHPLTDTGLGHLVLTVVENVRKAGHAGELRFHEHGEETVCGRKTRRIELEFPKDKAKGYNAYRMVINQDVESKILVRIALYDWDDHLFENYNYEELNLNAGLTDTDFDPQNPEYHF